MTAETPHENFIQRHLDPASRLGEILFGLIMVLTMTLTAGITVSEGPEGVRELLVAAIGCNIAWGFIDGIMYLMNCLTERSERARLVHSVLNAPDQEAALAAVRRACEQHAWVFASKDEREAMYRSILRNLPAAEVPGTKLTRDELLGAVASFWLVFISCLPAAIPFVIFSEPTRALRVSNLLLIGLLFVLGRKWGQFARVNCWLSGLAMVVIGLLLVGVAVLLGG